LARGVSLETPSAPSPPYGARDRHANALFVEQVVQVIVTLIHQDARDSFDLLLRQIDRGEALALRLVAQECLVFVRPDKIAGDHIVRLHFEQSGSRVLPV
jgi:hypothetical protein